MSHKVERLVNLTVALLETRRPLTFDELRTKTGYYRQRDAESGRRMFERDKDDLRQMGVPIETRPLPRTDEPGYTIDRDRYEMPAVPLDADEVAALAIALQVTGEERARLGLIKLAAGAPDPDASVARPPARVDVGAGAVEDIAEAIVERQALTFGYAKADGAIGQRTVDPYAIVQRKGHWYLIGRDHDRDAVRAFRLDRCTTPPRSTGDRAAFEVPPGLDVGEHISGPTEERTDVTLAIGPMAAWDAASRGGRHERDLGDGWAVYRFAGASPSRTLSWALGLGDQAEVLTPSDLRTRAVEHLARLAAGGAT